MSPHGWAAGVRGVPHTLAVLLALLAAAQAAAAPAAPDALALGAGGELLLVNGAGTITSSVGAFTPSADWSLDGSRLAYVNETGGLRALYVAAADGTGAREVRRQPAGEAWGPVLWVSPDEVTLFSIAAGSSSWTIRVVPVDGGGERVLEDRATLNLPPTLQPGGSLLAYGVVSANGRAVVDVRTGAWAPLPAGVAELAWSPDGRLLAAAVRGAVEVMRPDGTARRVVVPAPDARYASWPGELAWSPDGSRITFTRGRLYPELASRFGTPVRHAIYSVAADGSGLARLTGVAGDNLYDGGSNGSFGASWWPDGSRLFFRQRGDGPLLMMNADGTCETRWSGPPVSRPPRWRPGAAVSAGRIECSSVVVRLRTPLDEVGHRDALPLTVVLRNDGTRVLRDVRLSLGASLGTLTVRGRPCATGARVECALGDLSPGVELAIAAQARFRRPGRTRVSASTSYDGGPDIDPTDDRIEIARDVSACDLLGTWGNDRLVGTAGRELICGRPGADEIDARGGNDVIEAGSGEDRVRAGAGRDVVDGGGGPDTIRVRDGERDFVDCGTESDVVFADAKDELRRCERVRRSWRP